LFILITAINTVNSVKRPCNDLIQIGNECRSLVFDFIRTIFNVFNKWGSDTNESMKLTDIIGYVAAFGTTVSFLPQALKTIQTKDTSGISLSMYAIFTAGTFFWLLYGIMSSSWPVAIANAITLIFASIILIYKIRYK
jgi:MtN3 and saliva related transmembrane protein